MINSFCNRIGFPTEATELFVLCLHEIQKNSQAANKLIEARNLLFAGDTKLYRELLSDISALVPFHQYTVDMAFLLFCADKAKAIYDGKGISEDIYYATMSDLAEKMHECKRLYGIWGTFVVWWFPEFFRAERFTLGRLQFETREFPYDSYKGILRKGDTVYNFHVPACGPLTEEAVIKSFKEAYKFYNVSGVMPIFFSSWLIYPPHARLFAEGSNLKRFYDLFDVIDSKEHLNNKAIWRIFPILFSSDMDYSALPENTSLQRSFKKFFMDGGIMGDGKGIILFDGERIIYA